VTDDSLLDQPTPRHEPEFDMNASALPKALLGDKSALSQRAKDEIQALNGPRPGRFMVEILLAWLIIAVAIATAITANQWWVSITAILVVATRQNVLALLLHEQTHMSAIKGPMGDPIANIFCAYPMVIASVEGYSGVHLAHHRDYSSATDPDFQRKSGDDWQFPKSTIALLKLFVSDLFMGNTWTLIKKTNAKPTGGVPITRRFPTPKYVRPLFLLALIGVITYVGGWLYFLVYWMLPLLTIMPVIMRWGAICEHEYNGYDVPVISSTPIIFQSWWEKLLIPNLNFGLHPYHHFFPGVSFANLPKVHDIFVREGLVREQGVFRGSASYMKFITRDTTRAPDVSTVGQ
jgi:fatty acid desaturase